MKVYAKKPEEVVLNERLIKEKGLSDLTVQRLKESHVIKDAIFALMDEVDDPVVLRHLASMVENLEFAQQKLWGFPLDESFHLWYIVPKCTCPKMDNYDSRGVKDQRIIVSDCPIHWTEETQKRFDEFHKTKV